MRWYKRFISKLRIMYRLFVFALTLLALATADKVSYSGYKVFRVSGSGRDPRIRDVLSELKLETWHGVQSSSGSLDIIVPPDKLSEWDKMTRTLFLVPVRYVGNMQKLLNPSAVAVLLKWR